MGEDRPPQLTATKAINYITVLKGYCSKSITFSTNFFLPSQKLSFPLQFPVDRHCLIFDPRRLKPSSHINCTFCGYVVRLPTKDPLLGVLRAPQSFAVKKAYNIRLRSYTLSRWAVEYYFEIESLYRACLRLILWYRNPEKKCRQFSHQCSNQLLHQNAIAFLHILPKTINKGPYDLPKVQNELKGKICFSNACERQKHFGRRGLNTFYGICPLNFSHIIPLQTVL